MEKENVNLGRFFWILKRKKKIRIYVWILDSGWCVHEFCISQKMWQILREVNLGEEVLTRISVNLSVSPERTSDFRPIFFTAASDISVIWSACRIEHYNDQADGGFPITPQHLYCTYLIPIATSRENREHCLYIRSSDRFFKSRFLREFVQMR